MSAVLNQERKRARGTSRPPERRPLLSPSESTTMLTVGFRIPGVLVAIIATVVLVTLVSVNSELTGTFGAIAGLWFAIHQVPFSIEGTSLGVFPLVPTLVLVLVVARGVARAVGRAETRREHGLIVGAAVFGPVLVTAIALAVAADASSVIGLDTPNALLAFAWVAAVHAVSAGIGLVCGVWATESDRLPEWLRGIVAPTIRAAAVLVAGGGAIVLAAMLASWSTMEMLLESGNGFVGVLGLTVLSILYLPNVLLGAIAVSVGSSAHVGDVSVSMFQATGGPLPPLPVLAVLPEGPSQTLWMLMLVIPIGAGLLLGRDCARRTVDVHYALSAVWVASAMIGVSTLVLGFAAGGNLGTFGTVQVTVWSLGLLVFAWLAVVGSLAAAVTAWRGGSKQTPIADDVDTEPRREQEPIAAIAAPVAHPEHAVDAEIVEEPDALPETVDSPDVDAAVVAEDTTETEDIVDAEIVEEVPSEATPPDDGNTDDRS
ncbi:cell division protein PerM [Rhodococcus sp. 114MFTsu3.1]|uniref:cell division protein PerM n=1 Tax=Rhodococcus sp. 114MFTsu3.1 TaxID=1172184 RepID=UPI001E534A84|nr:DUF6350 family protein [Rhodococcus sp. 114MFTsu3.1]